MISPDDVHSMTEFQRNSKAFVRRLRKSGRPEVLTVNGEAAVVVQDAAAYASMLRAWERAYTIEAVRVGIEQMKTDPGVPLEQVAREMRAKYGKRARQKRTA